MADFSLPSTEDILNKLETDPTLQKLDQAASLFPLYDGIKDSLKGQAFVQSALSNPNLSPKEKAVAAGQGMAMIIKARAGIALDIITMGGDTVVQDLAKTSGKEFLTKLGPGLTELSERLAEKSPQTAQLFSQVGQWSQTSLAENPDVGNKLGELLDTHVFDPLKTQIKESQTRVASVEALRQPDAHPEKIQELFQKNTQTPTPPSNTQPQPTPAFGSLPKDPKTLDGRLMAWFEHSRFAQKADALGSLVPFYSSLRDMEGGFARIQEGLKNTKLSPKERLELAGVGTASVLWAQTQGALDVITLGEDKVVIDALEKFGGKGLLAKIGPDLQKFAGKIAADSPEAADFLASLGKWTETTLAANPQLHDMLGKQLDDQLLNRFHDQLQKSKARAATYRALQKPETRAGPPSPPPAPKSPEVSAQAPGRQPQPAAPPSSGPKLNIPVALLAPFSLVKTLFSLPATARAVRDTAESGKKYAAAGIVALAGLGSLIVSNVASASTVVVTAIGQAAAENMTAIFAIVLTVPIVLAFFIYIITNSAYVVPTSPYSLVSSPGGGVLLPPGGTIDCAGAGNSITAPDTTLQLLPDSIRVRQLKMCIIPIEIVIHWSGGVVNGGAQATYNTLASRDIACHFATDPAVSLQMLQLWEKKVEFSSCQGSHNGFAIGIEMSGTCFSSMPGVCDGVNTPPPEAEIQRTVNLVCWLRKQYNINSVIGHYEIPNSGKSDPGSEFLHNVFLPRVESQCGALSP